VPGLSDTVIRQAIERITPRLIEDRRWLHAHPELGMQEVETARFVAERLCELGYEVRTGVAETGVLGTLRGVGPGPVVLLRADLDALPIQEENDVSYRSTVPGLMHACGHDAHTAILLGVAETLAGLRADLPGTVKLAFQPAEENEGGAERMIAAGVLDDPAVDACFGLHVDAELDVGTIGVRSGAFMAAEDDFTATIQGRGGHAAEPHLTVDAALIACEVVVALQSLVSREVDPLLPAVVTVGKVQAGTARNVIADSATIEGTVRTFDREVRDLLAERIPAVIASIAAVRRGRAEVEYERGYAAVINDPALAELMRTAAVATVGEERVWIPPPTMGSDDVSAFLEAVPGCYCFVGARDAASGKTWGHHHPRFDIDERCLPIGAELLVRTALARLARR
jgi:amidohydrolase